MARRLPGVAPTLPGYTFVHPLGTGGFADVFLYEQAIPRRRIAVKVLLIGGVTGDLRAAFLQETNTLAHLASHPHVLTMYEAGISADGRPYLVTEYCPEGYGKRFREEQISVTEVLSVGLGIGAALHTAHVAGVLHRDVKPANVLITDFGRPVLADFGIAATLHRVSGEQPIVEDEDPSEVGLSIPWAPPEALQGQSTSGVAAEIYSFGATLYALLTGRSPYETPEGPNDRMALARRIMGRAKPLPIDRPDAPQALLDLIEDCLQSIPANRPADMLTVLHRLQLAESELGLRPTPLELARHAPAPLPEAPGPSGLAGTATGRLESLGTDTTSGTKRRKRRVSPSAYPDDSSPSGADATRLRGPVQTTRTGRRWWVIGVGAAVILACLAVLVWWHPWASGPGKVSGLKASSEASSVSFTWNSPSTSVDGYVVRVQGQASETVTVPRYRVDTTKAGQRVCLSVQALKDGNVGEATEPACARAAAEPQGEQRGNGVNR